MLQKPILNFYSWLWFAFGWKLKLVAAHASHNDMEFNETIKSIALAERKKGNTAYSISLKRLLSSGITTHAVNKHPFNENSKNLFELVSDTRDKNDLIINKNIKKALEEVIPNLTIVISWLK